MALTKVKGHIIADDLALGGNPTTSTQSTGNNTTRLATTAFVQTELAALGDSAPAALNTLNELAAAMGDDANFSTTVTNSIAAKLPLAGGTMTGSIIFDNNVQAIKIKDAAGTAGYVFYLDNADTLVVGNGTIVEKIRLDTSGNEGAITIDTDGKVGIAGNTAAPNFPLHINKGTSSYAPTSGVNENVFGINTSYNAAGPQGVTLSRLDGNWIDGTSGADSAWGWLWNYENNVRGGLVYDHRGIERMQMWSAYGAIGFMTSNSADTNAVPADSNMSERLTILAGGNVGIGTTSPTKQLTISGADAEFLLSRTGSYADTINMGMPSGVPTIVGGTDLAFGGSGAWTEHMRIKSDGNVGIGTNAPGRKFTVQGASGDNLPVRIIGGASTAKSAIEFQDANTTADYKVTLGSKGDGLFFQAGGTERLNILNSGNVGIGTASPGEKLEVNGIFQIKRAGDHPAMRFVEDTTTRGYIASGDWAVNGLAQADFGISSVGVLAFATTGGVERMRILTNGNVGIGVTSPNNKLEVDGHIGFSKNGTSGNRYLLIEGASGTYAGTMNIQAGFGSTAAGGGLKLYAHSHATYPGSAWLGRSAGAAGNIMFGNGGTGPTSTSQIQMVIDSSGNIGMSGIIAPAKLGLTGSSVGKVLHLGGDDCQLRLANSILHHDNSGNTTLHLRNHYTTLGNDNAAKIRIESGKIEFATSTGYTARWQINSSGHFTPGQQHAVDIGGTNAEVRHIYAQGISFASNANASGKTTELLDDYEEGSWTPILQNTGGTTATHSSQHGKYTKVGDLVHVHGTITCSSGANLSGTVIIAGLPFASNSGGGYRNVGQMGALSGAGANGERCRLVLDPNNSYIFIIKQNGTGYSHNPGFESAINIYGFSIVYSAAT